MEEESSTETEDEDDDRPMTRAERQAANQLGGQLSAHIGQNAEKKASSMQPPLPPAPDKVIVKKGYNPKQSKLIYLMALYENNENIFRMCC